MGKFITLREEFESETGAQPFADQQYIEWLEKVVERQKQVKNCSIPYVEQSEQLVCECGKNIRSKYELHVGRCDYCLKDIAN